MVVGRLILAAVRHNGCYDYFSVFNLHFTHIWLCMGFLEPNVTYLNNWVKLKYELRVGNHLVINLFSYAVLSSFISRFM